MDPTYNIDFSCNTVMAKSTGSCQMHSDSDTRSDVKTENESYSMSILSSIVSWFDIGCLCLIMIVAGFSCFAYCRVVDSISYIWLNIRRLSRRKLTSQTQKVRVPNKNISAESQLERC